MTIFREAIGGYGIGTGSFDKPVDVAVDAAGSFYVLDGGNNRVQVFDSFANFVLTFGTYGSRNGEFFKPGAIAVVTAGSAREKHDFVYVVDTGNNRVQKFEWVDNPDRPVSPARADGKRLNFIKSFGSLGSRTGDFKAPRDIVFDNSGNSYILDSGNQRVQIFDASDRFTGEWGGTFASRGGVFADLTSIAWSDERMGFIYVLGAGCLVQQFKLDGSLERSWSAIAPESGLCVPGRLEIDNKNDYVYALDAGNSLLVRFNRDGRYLAALRGAQRPFLRPLGFAINPDRDEVLVADTENNIVQKFTLR